MTTYATPIKSFKNSHSGIVSQLDRLAGLPALLAPAELARKTADDALGFFRKAVYAHHSDEEKVLFPAVIESATPGDERQHVQTLVKQLVAQHRTLEGLWEKIEPELKKVAKGSSTQVDTEALQALVRLYQEHAQFEEEAFLPMSQQVLSRNNNHMEALGLSLRMHHVPLPVSHI